MRKLVVQESFDIASRGVAIVFVGTTEGLPVGRAFSVSIRRPDGSSCTGDATVEFIRRTQVPTVELSALFLQGMRKSEIPPGSVVTVGDGQGDWP